MFLSSVTYESVVTICEMDMRHGPNRVVTETRCQDLSERTLEASARQQGFKVHQSRSLTDDEQCNDQQSH